MKTEKSIVSNSKAIKIFYLFIYIFLSYVTPRLYAQEIFLPPPAKLISTFKFEHLTGGIILIRGTIDNFSDSLNFILDTGSGGISLDSTTTEELHLPVVPTERTIRGIAGIRKVDYALDHTLHLPGVKTDSLDFHINDYSLLTAVYGIRIDGIIGYSLLRKYIIYVDYDYEQISFYTPGSFKYSRGGTLLRPSFNNLPIQSATVRDNVTIRQRFYFDTGGGICVLLSEDFVADSTLFTKKKKIVKTLTEGLGGKKIMRLTTVKEVKLGPYKFKKVPTYIFDDEYNVTNYPALGGLLGADLLRRFNITLNYPKGEIYLMPNSHFRDPFDYSYTGMEIYYENHKIVVGDIIDNSPAAKAGLMVGDIIFSVENVIGTSFQNIRTLLRSADKKVKMIIIRNSQIIEIKMKIASIK